MLLVKISVVHFLFAIQRRLQTMALLKQYEKPNNVVAGVIVRSPADVDVVGRLLEDPNVVDTSCPAIPPHHVPRLRINVSGQTFELPVALLARHPGTVKRTL